MKTSDRKGACVLELENRYEMYELMMKFKWQLCGCVCVSCRGRRRKRERESVECEPQWCGSTAAADDDEAATIRTTRVALVASRGSISGTQSSGNGFAKRRSLYLQHS